MHVAMVAVTATADATADDGDAPPAHVAEVEGQEGQHDAYTEQAHEFVEHHEQYGEGQHDEYTEEGQRADQQHAYTEQQQAYAARTPQPLVVAVTHRSNPTER
jgi:hypothetical protein